MPGGGMEYDEEDEEGGKKEERAWTVVLCKMEQ